MFSCALQISDEKFEQKRKLRIVSTSDIPRSEKPFSDFSLLILMWKNFLFFPMWFSMMFILYQIEQTGFKNRNLYLCVRKLRDCAKVTPWKRTKWCLKCFYFPRHKLSHQRRDKKFHELSLKCVYYSKFDWHYEYLRSFVDERILRSPFRQFYSNFNDPWSSVDRDEKKNNFPRNLKYACYYKALTNSVTFF